MANVGVMGDFSDPETKDENPGAGKNVTGTQKSRADLDKEEENESHGRCKGWF